MWLPPKDDVLAPGIFNEGTPGPRWFDFSSAPDMPAFDSSSCAADITWAGQRAFHMYQCEIPVVGGGTAGGDFFRLWTYCMCVYVYV